MKRFFLLTYGLWLSVFLLPLFTPRDPVAVFSAPEVVQNAVDAETSVTVLTDGKVETMALDVYLQGVVAAEMPALFPEEALKAQAVAARTYTMKRASETPDASHKGAMVCDNPNHCKAYKPLTQYTANWGASGSEYAEKIKAAVDETDGEIVLYDGAPISAVFHSSSAKKTEAAADVWGRDVPYLQSVESVGDAEAPNYESTVRVPFEEFRKTVQKTYSRADFNKTPLFGEPVRSGAGGVKTVSVGGVNITGREMRVMFGLKSTNFKITQENGEVVFQTVGYGHGVGMSQYGARALALQGMDYREILSHYYTDTTLGKIEKEV